MPKNWKAVTLDYAELSNYDDIDSIFVCLTQRQVAILKALLGTAYWQTRWSNSSQTKDQLEASMAEIDYRLDGNECEGNLMIDFRDNPVDPCEVQYSTDSGATWLTMFRKDNCAPGATEESITNVYNDIDIVNINFAIWNGDIVNNAPQWGWSGANSDKAICWLVNQYVDDICDFAIKQIDAHNEELRSANDFIEDLSAIIANGVIAGIAASAGAITVPAVLVGAATWGITAIMLAVFDSLLGVSADAFKDEDARDIVKCTMYYALKGATPQYDVWETSLQYWSGLGGNAKIIANTVNNFNQSTDYYINYMILWEDINSISATLPECPCADTWEHYWDFENVGMEVWTLLQEYGEYIEGYGVRTQLRTAGTWIENLIQAIRFGVDAAEVVPRCTGWEFHVDMQPGNWERNRVVVSFSYSPIGVWDATIAFINPAVHSHRENFAETDLTYTQFDFIMSCSTENPLDPIGFIRIAGITLYGNGPDPFYGRITG